MKCLCVLTALLLTLVVGVIAALAITFGEPDDGNHPNVCAVMVIGNVPVCSGTLIHERVILTAGHCTDYLESLLAIEAIEMEDVRVSFDEELSEQSFDEGFKVEAIFTHPDYPGPGGSFDADAHDIGLLVLERPVEDRDVANLADVGFLDQLRADGKLRQRGKGAQFTVVGYGGSLEWPPPNIFFEDARQFAQSEFRNLRRGWLQLSQVHAPGTNDAGTCYGDSGGPTFWTKPDGREILVAVTSWGDEPCVALGNAYRVDTANSLAFIEEVIANLP